MSVAARSPHHGNKRHFDQGTDSPEHHTSDRSSGPSHKRLRHYTPQTLRCSPFAERQPYVVSSTTLQALKGLFPDMDDKVRNTFVVISGHFIKVCTVQGNKDLALCRP